jgi:hypothetical protein
MARGLLDAAQIPGDVFAGRRPANVENAVALSGMIGSGGLLSPRPAGSLGMFGGVRAKTANLPALQMAKNLNAKGFGAEDIRQITGWHQGSDKKWRFEISDDLVQLDMNALAAHGRSSPLSEVVIHQRLLKAYPELKDLRIGREISPTKRGGFNIHDNKITVGGGKAVDQRNSVFLDTLVHELQHKIQQIEGFAQGTNPGAPSVHKFHTDAKDTLKRMDTKIKDLSLSNVSKRKAGDTQGADADMSFREGLVKMRDETVRPMTKLSAFEIYRKFVGEVEADLSANRRRLTPEQRQPFSPLTDPTQQIKGLLSP